MFKFLLSIGNPFKSKLTSDDKQFIFKSVSHEEKIPYTQYKNYCIECCYSNELYELLVFNIDLNWTGVDHAGPFIYIDIFGLIFHFKIYDSRHWNYETNDWESHN